MSHALTIVVAAGTSGPTSAYGRGGIGGGAEEPAGGASGSGAHEAAAKTDATTAVRRAARATPARCRNTSTIANRMTNDSPPNKSAAPVLSCIEQPERI